MTKRDNPNRRPGAGGNLPSSGQRPESPHAGEQRGAFVQSGPDGPTVPTRRHGDVVSGESLPGAMAAGSVQIPQPANDPRFPPAPPTQSQHAAAARPGRAQPKRRRWRWLVGLAIFFGVAGGAMLVAVAALQIRLNKGPIDIPQLVGPVERGLSREFGDRRVRIGSVALYRAEASNRIEFRLTNLRLVDENGVTALRVPTAAIDISRNALLLWTVAPKRIDLIRPRLVMSYDEQSGLALRFAGFDARGGPSVEGTTEETGVADQPLGGTASGVQDPEQPSVGLVQVLRDTFRTARERQASTAFLKSVGVRDAVIVLRTGERETTWTAPGLALELRHQRSRSIIRGNGTMTDGTAPWAFAFEIDDTPARGAFQVRTIFKDVVPREFGRAIPALADLNTLETPLSGQADFQLAQDGKIAAANADIVIGAGYMTSDPSDDSSRVLLDEGHLQLAYDGERQIVRLEKLDLLTGKGRMVLVGEMTPTGIASPEDGWNFDLKGKLRFAAQSQAVTPLSDVAFSGFVDPDRGDVRIDRMNIAWPEGQVAGRARFSRSGEITVAGQLGEMSKAGLLQAWPPFLAVDARSWIDSSLAIDQVTGGQFSISLPADFRARMRKGSDIPAEAVSFDISGSGMDITYLNGVPPVHLDSATASIRGRTLRVKAPRGHTRLPSGKRVRLAQSDFTVRDLRQTRPAAQMFLKVKGSAAAMTEYLELKGMGYLKPGIVPKGIKGTADGIIRLKFPLHSKLDDSEIKLNGKIKLTNGASRNVVGNLDVAGGAIDFDLTEKAVEASGDILVNGVPAKVRWLRLLEGAEDKQPPLRVTAKLDAADRKQVGLNINHFVSGTIATDVTIVPRVGRAPEITVQADLTQAEVALDYLAWQKAVGASAVVQFDVVSTQGGSSELQNFKVVGDNIAIDGWLELGPDNRVRRFALPEFSIDVITRMEVKGELGKNNIWDVQMRAQTFDARPVFRNLFSPKRFTEHVAPKESRRAGVIIRAFIKNMVGFSNASLKDAQIVLQRLDGKVTGMEANGALDSGAPITVSLQRNSANRRILFAETKDAGGAFKLVGFYRNIRKGEAKLQVNLDDPGLADVSGILWTRNFFMLGDPIVNEVLESSGRRDDAAPIEGIRTRRDERGVRRTVIQFDQLRFNFSVGKGQFLLDKSYVNGPALGATLNGKVDFDRRRVNLGGTYVPLYGLNSALGSVPILGELLVGRLGEGVLGITFAIQGRLDKPDVLVNPVSLVAPGIFRQIFEISPQRQSITPRRSRRNTPQRKTPATSAPANSSWPVDSRN